MEQENKKKSVVKNFSPSWFAAIMGTGVIPIAMSLNDNIVPAFNQIGLGFFTVNIALFAIVFAPWLLRFLGHFEDIKKDFTHPVMASFFPTFGIAVMVIATNLLILGRFFSDETTIRNLVTILFVIGSGSIILFGFIIFPIIFISNKINIAHGSFAWFIPAVAHMVIPLVGLELVNQYKNTELAALFFIMSMIGFGVGLILFMYIGSAVYHRYLYHDLLMPKLAPTLFIGLVPPAMITIICVKITVSMHNLSFFNGADILTMESLAKVIGLIMWGFSVWWFIFAAIVIIYHILKKNLPYALSWWAFTFPTGVLAVATGVMNKLLKIQFLDYTLTGMIVVMLLIWGTVAFYTFRAIADKSVFE